VRLLLDAHSLLWWVTESPRLTTTARDAIADPANDVVIGIGALWEIGIKRSLGKMHFPFDFESVLGDEAIGILPIVFAHLRVLDGLPAHHRDPFDRLLIAQALAEGIPIVTADRAFAGYGVTVVW
jgi:PIN domain nuclease of toxin-antitoxin system